MVLLGGGAHDLKDLIERERRETTGYEPFEREVGILLALGFGGLLRSPFLRESEGGRERASQRGGGRGGLALKHPRKGGTLVTGASLTLNPIPHSLSFYMARWLALTHTRKGGTLVPGERV